MNTTTRTYGLPKITGLDADYVVTKLTEDMVTFTKCRNAGDEEVTYKSREE